jgi:RNA polymerase sigma-70 factor (ECF subfamily)
MSTAHGGLDATFEQARQGDRQAFTDLVRAHENMVFSLLWHMLGEAAVAEEIAQDVFLEMHKHLPGIESPEHLTRWLRMVAGRRGIDEIRRRRFRSDKPVEDCPEPRAETSHPDPFLAGRIRRLIERLPARHRAIVVMRFQEDLGPADIASALDIPVSTVKSTLHRTLTMLRTRLAQPVLAARQGEP